MRNEYKAHHTSLTIGYLIIKENEGIKEQYIGKFGEGYTIRSHNPNSTRYCYITYYVA